MPVNLNRPHLWNADIARSVDMYNAWFMNFAPDAFRQTRVSVTIKVEEALRATDFLRDIRPETLIRHPEILQTLRMSTCPPIAVDRLIGLAGVSPNVVKAMEISKRVPPRMPAANLRADLEKIGVIIERMIDPDIFVWLFRGDQPSEIETHRAATIVADRLCGAVANPIIRNAQEKRQLAEIKAWLEARGYTHVVHGSQTKFN
ncbi:MAG: XamI family restriction endonuclease [Sphingomonadales bacterium]|nr:XamI family restriction endonuclease [Sphingomonadales bacterium]